MTLEEIAAEMQETAARLSDAKAVSTELQKKWDELRKVTLPDKMEELGLESARVAGVGTVSLRTDAYCSTPADNRAALQAWMLEHGHSDMITEVINGSTLKAWYKEQLLAGGDLPTELVKFSPYTYAAITGAPK